MKPIIALVLIIGVISAKPADPPKKYYVFKLTKLNWYGAFIDCLSRDLQLATINSAAEQSAIEKAMKEAGTENDWLWVSASDLAEEGSFVWMSTGKSVQFSKWGAGQPDNAGGIENCVHMWNTKGSLGIWNDWQCLQKIYYVCEDKPPHSVNLDINPDVNLVIPNIEKI